MAEFKRNAVDTCFIHCSATPPSMDIGDDEIKKMHLARGWDDIGYHVVIRRNGDIEYGRALDVVGAHVKGHNSHSVGVCLVGGIDSQGKSENNYTTEQWDALGRVMRALNILFPEIIFRGHNEVAAKDCPCFNVAEYCDSVGFKRYHD